MGKKKIKKLKDYKLLFFLSCLPHYAEAGIGRCLLTSVGLLVEQYTDENREGWNVPNK